MSFYDGPIFKVTSTCKGGGYLYAKTEPPHPKANSKGLYPLHRVLMENILNRQLGPKEVVHHKDGDKFNNEYSNLEVLTNRKHSSVHKAVDMVECKCSVCGKVFSVKPYFYRLRMKRSKYSTLFCSHSCGAKHQFNPEGRKFKSCPRVIRTLPEPGR